MYTRILVPLDGSELAERALPAAERLARATGATVHLVRVVPLLPASTWAAGGLAVPATIYEDVTAAETEAAQAYVEAARARLAEAGAAVHAVTLSGEPAATLLDYERDGGIDLVVMCSHGRTGLARFALGSVAARLVRHGAAPVLLVRPFGEPVTLEHAVVPLDGSPLAEMALDAVDHLARYVVREVTLLRVVATPEQGSDAEQYLAAVSGRLTQEHVACWRRVAQGDPAQAIIAEAGTDRLIVMATHGRTGVTRWALGSVADRVAHGGTAGLLLVRVGAQEYRDGAKLPSGG